jgi:Holliday junction DNA helicase RuvA
VIASVRGLVLGVGPDHAVVQVGGVGLLVQAAPHTLAELREGGNALLHTSLVVREDSLTLFGFGTADERGVFELLQSATGVGPKVAQAMLGVMRPDELRRAIGGGDLAALTRVPGVGKKGAERIVVELRDRIGPPVASTSRGSAASASIDAAAAAWMTPLTEALVGLGWSTREAEAAVLDVEPLAQDGAELPDLLKAALRSLRRT